MTGHFLVPCLFNHILADLNEFAGIVGMDGDLILDTFRVDYRTRQYCRSYVPAVAIGWRYMRGHSGALKMKSSVPKLPMGEITLEKDLELSDEEAAGRSRGRKVRCTVKISRKPGSNEDSKMRPTKCSSSFNC